MKSPTTLPVLSTVNVADIELPRELESLYRLAYNLWWSWTPEARQLFASIDPAAWSRYRNPVQLLINVEPRHWYPLLEDEGFLTRYRRVVEGFDRYLTAEDTWFQEHPESLDGPIGYVSMEFGLHESLAIYSGGLGILSGDHAKSASDLGLPLIAIGLLYRRGYFQQSIDSDGIQQHTYPEYDFSRLPLRPLASVTGSELRISVPLPGRDLAVRLWLAEVGRVPLVLLDTDVPENDPADRPITNLLYVKGREMRLVQEVLLGVGAARALAALGIEPSVWHINEGHSAFLQLERMRALRSDGLSIVDAQERVRRATVFTTHTPVPAGNEQFDRELVLKYTAGMCEEAGLATEDFLALGRAAEGDTRFNLTAMAIRTSARTNGVSRLNAEITSEMWRHLFAGDDPRPIGAITNGIHTKSWLGIEISELLTRHLGDDWPRRLARTGHWHEVEGIPDEALWRAHMAQKERLGRYTRSLMRNQLARHGMSPDELRAVEGLFDARALTIGFARRFATYKRANLLFSDRDRLRALLTDAERPLQVVFAGKAHPADRPGQELIRNIVELSHSEGLGGTIFFLENYDMRMGRMLVQGVDVWLNTPRRPLEASGTSGMKVAANGGLNCSILDGWWPEGYDGENGWQIGDHDMAEDESEQDRRDADALYRVLADEVVPLYFDQDAAAVPHRWVARMKHAIATLTAQFSADRMVRDYVLEAYVPTARANGRLRLREP